MSPHSPEAPRIEELVEELLQSTGQLLRRLRAEGNAAELSWSQSAILSRLQKGGPSSTADLARAERVKPQSMGATMAALEREGLVKRQPHPSDGRQALYDLTDLGRAAKDQQRLLKREWLASAMAGLEEQDKQALSTALGVIRRLARA
ncbi:MAG TPA: MarR family transcriptional regulator [Sphingobium sp.]|uniref:MarR family winged helix-turn-helix transcriptional regulator n=1 Tax=Sphingobium sp. TaxID=1912891 RepID=UPI002ED2D59A